MSQYGNAVVYGNASVCDNVVVRDSAVVCGNALVRGNAVVRGNADYITVGPIGSENGTLTICRSEGYGLVLTRGCFTGSLTQFMQAVKKTHGDNEHGKMYHTIVSALVTTRFPENSGELVVRL